MPEPGEEEEEEEATASGTTMSLVEGRGQRETNHQRGKGRVRRAVELGDMERGTGGLQDA